MGEGHYYFMVKTESLDKADESKEHRNLLLGLVEEAV
jgi:hypothetical protein